MGPRIQKMGPVGSSSYSGAWQVVNLSTLPYRRYVSSPSGIATKRSTRRKKNQIGRKRLQASKLRLLQIGGLPDINELVPAKPNWTRRKTYQRIRNEIQALEAKAKTL